MTTDAREQKEKMNSLERSVEELKFPVPWGHVAAKAWGCPDADRVFVAHGMMDNAGSFDRIIPMLPDKFYYVAVDLPGHGLSSPLPAGIQLDYMNYVLAVRLVLDQLQWNNCIYVGHSFGSQLGMFIGILYPGRIAKLVCLDGCLPYPTDSHLLETMLAVQNAAVEATNPRTPTAYTKAEILYALKNRRQFPLNAAAADALFPRATTEVGHDAYTYNRDFRLRATVNPLLNTRQYFELLRRVKIPVFVILAEASWFSNESYAPIFQKLLRSTPPNFTIITVPGNHDVHNNDPEIVAPHVTAFFNDAGKSKL